MNATSRIITAEDRNAVAQLQLLARGVVEGVTLGRHRSPYKGASVEFKEHRQYVRGDEYRSIDWKLFGKTDRLFIRQFEDETNLRAMILVDQSGSMAYAGSRSGTSKKQTLTKHQYATRLAACMATLLIAQQDAVGLALIDTELRESIPPRSSPRHLQAVMHALVRSQPAGETRLSSAVGQALKNLPKRGLLILISDCFDHVDELIKSLRIYRHAGSEVIVFQVWDPDEKDFPFRNPGQFRSIENPVLRRTLDPQVVRRAYLKQVEKFESELRSRSARERIELIPCVTNQPYAEILSQYVTARGENRLSFASNARRGLTPEPTATEEPR